MSYQSINSWWVLFAFGVLLPGCQTTTEVENTIEPSPGKVVHLLDSIQAAQQLQTDKKEGFFEKISPLDTRLQMGIPLDSAIPAPVLRKNYKPFLAKQAMPLKATDRALLKAAFEQAYALCDSLNPNLLPDTVLLGKMETNIFGPSVYFTREKAIFIPKNELYEGNRALLPVLLHELFHIISRYNSAVRTELYALIGYQRLNAPLHFPPQLLERRLLNPDGIDHNYAIELPDSTGKAQHYISVITADTADNYPGKRYFDYIDFSLYPLLPTDTGYTVQPQGLAPEIAPGFFGQIGDNTGYIIHPDEILADNFVLLVLRKAGPKNYAARPLSERGETLIRQMEAVLKR